MQNQGADRPAEPAGIPLLEPAEGHEHRSAVRIVRVIRIPEEHGLGHLGGLERHADDADDPHPEDGPGATDRDRDRDTTDVAEPDRGRESRRERLEVADGTGIVGVVVATGGDGDAVGQGTPLADAAPEREEQSDGEHGVEDPVGPDDSRDRFDEVVEAVHWKILCLLVGECRPGCESVHQVKGDLVHVDQSDLVEQDDDDQQWCDESNEEQPRAGDSTVEIREFGSSDACGHDPARVDRNEEAAQRQHPVAG